MNLEDTKRIVIKIGSSLLFHEDSNKLNEKWLSSLAEDIRYLNENHKEVIIVTSGAIALGAKDLDLDSNEMKLDINQAISSVGQIHLMSSYKNAFEKNAWNSLTAQLIFIKNVPCMERFLFITVYEKSYFTSRFFNLYSSLNSSRNSMDVHGPGAACPTKNTQKNIYGCVHHLVWPL